MQTWESLVFATILATVITFLFLWVLHYAFKKMFTHEAQEFQETISYEDRRQSTVVDLVLEKVISIEKKVISIDEKISK